jgi:hypothetical protein
MDNDPRLSTYIDAIQAGRLDDCVKMRQNLKADPILTRFDTVDKTISDLRHLHVREIQVCQREIRGWKNLASGYEIITLTVGVGPQRTHAQRLIKAGLQQLGSVRVLREQGEVVDVPVLKG